MAFSPPLFSKDCSALVQSAERKLRDVDGRLSRGSEDLELVTAPFRLVDTIDPLFTRQLIVHSVTARTVCSLTS